MRVLHINCNYIGSPLHQNMINHLDLLDVQNQVFVATYDKNVGIIEVNDNVSVSECFKKRDRYVFDYKQNKILKALENIYNINEFDIIHAYTLFTDGNSAMKLSKKYHIPYVVAVRNTDVYTFFQKMYYLRSRGVEILLNAKKVFFQSSAYQDVVLNRYVPEKYKEQIKEKCMIIPNGIDDFWFENESDGKREGSYQRIAAKTINLVYAGRIDRNKNIELIFEALDKLNNGGWKARLMVVGKVENNAVYELICKNSFTSYIEPMPKEELIDVYRENDIFVMPSHHETFGLVYAEAMTQGLPVIYTRGQGFDGQFPEGDVGYATSDMDSDELVKNIFKIIENYKFYVSNNALKARKFKWEDICRDYKRIYEI